MSLTVDDFYQCFPTLARSTDRSHISALLDAVDTRQIPAGHTLIQENESSSTFYMLLEGSLNVTIEANGQILSLGKIGKGGCVGEISMLDDAPATATVTADTDSTVLALTEEKFWKLDKQNPAVTTTLLRSLSHMMSDRIRAATEMILPLLDSEEAPGDRAVLSSMLGNAYANLYGLGEKA
jgi:CRP-like cAMP-binding protein